MITNLLLPSKICGKPVYVPRAYLQIMSGSRYFPSEKKKDKCRIYIYTKKLKTAHQKLSTSSTSPDTWKSF